MFKRLVPARCCFQGISMPNVRVFLPCSLNACQRHGTDQWKIMMFLWFAMGFSGNDMVKLILETAPFVFDFAIFGL